MRGDRIESVGTRQSVTIDPDATVIDLTGRFVLPGLIDVHVHYFEWMGELFLAHGVTTVKDVGNDVAWISQARDETESAAPAGRGSSSPATGSTSRHHGAITSSGSRTTTWLAASSTSSSKVERWRSRSAR